MTLIITIILLIAVTLLLVDIIQDSRNKTFLTYNQKALLMVAIITISTILTITSSHIVAFIASAASTCIWGYNLYTLQTSKLGKPRV